VQPNGELTAAPPVETARSYLHVGE
jgi:hypothetical protein